MEAFFLERPAGCDVNFIANGKVPLGIRRDSRHLMQTWFNCTRPIWAWWSPAVWGMGELRQLDRALLVGCCAPVSPLPFHCHVPSQPGWVSFLSIEPHPCLLLYCRLKAWVACEGYQLMNKLQSSCPVINLSRRSKMKHVDLFLSNGNFLRLSDHFLRSVYIKTKTLNIFYSKCLILSFAKTFYFLSKEASPPSFCEGLICGNTSDPLIVTSGHGSIFLTLQLFLF